MRRYQTEVVIPADRRIALRIPALLPEGRAVLTIEVMDVETVAPNEWSGVERDGQDIEWWDEFDEESDNWSADLPSSSESSPA